MYDEELTFESDQDEITYLRKRLEECQQELEEFQESSRELERELETQLSQTEKRNQEYSSLNSRLQSELESLKMKYNKLSQENQQQVLSMQNELLETEACNDRLTRYIRELEQSNDDLERAKRALVASLEDFESRLNHQIERNVLLENELGEKEDLEVVVQRLRDEARDLKHELLVQQNQQPTGKTLETESRRSSIICATNNNINSKISNNLTDSKTNGRNVETQANGTPVKQSRSLFYPSNKSSPNSPSGQNPPLPLLSPSTRISALNIVSDLLRKVGALESKLSSCRNIVPPGTPKSKSSANATPITSPSTIKDMGREIMNKE